MKNKRKELIAPIVVTVLVVLYYIAYFGFLIAMLEGGWKYILGIFPIVVAVAMIMVCIERIKEIKRGENDDISKYWLY